MFDPPKSSTFSLNPTLQNNRNPPSSSPTSKSPELSRLTIRRSSFQERAPTPVPPFVAPDVEVPKEMLKQQLKKYSYLPSNVSSDGSQPRPSTPIPSETVLRDKKQVFQLLNRNNMDDVMCNNNGNAMNPQERHDQIVEALSKNIGGMNKL